MIVHTWSMRFERLFSCQTQPSKHCICNTPLLGATPEQERSQQSFQTSYFITSCWIHLHLHQPGLLAIMEHWPEGVDSRSGYCSSDGVFYSKRRIVPEVPNEAADSDLITFLFAPQFGDRVALIDALTGRSLTYKELERTVCALATRMAKVVGVRQHDVVALLLSNCIEFPVIYFAVTWLGAVAVPLNPLNTAQELRKQMNDAGAKCVFTAADHQLLEKVAAAHLPTVVVGSMETATSNSMSAYCYSDLVRTEVAQDVSRPQVKQSDTVAILFSSGTTGRSKGVELTHRNFIASVRGHGSCYGENLTSTLVVLPMYHAFGFSVGTLLPLVRGMSVAVLGKFESRTVLGVIQKYRVTHMASVPPMVKALVNVDEVQKFDLRSWVHMECGAAPLGPETAAAFTEKFPFVKLIQEYGMTETSGCVTTLADDDDDHVGSSGMLLPFWEAMVVDLVTKQPVPPTKQGELWVRGPSVMKGYLNNLKATEDVIDRNGWLCSGDLAKFDEDGYLYIVDRLKQLIKYKGYQVAPAELEDLLSSHPAVMDCGVIPYPDKASGQIPVAFIVRRGGFKITAEDIMQWVAKQVAPYKKV